MNEEDVLKGVSKPPHEGDYVWNGIDEDDRPLTKEEMLKGIKKQKRDKDDYIPHEEVRRMVRTGDYSALDEDEN